MVIEEKRSLSLDHVLVTVNDYPRTLNDYTRLGFMHSPVSLHPWGTSTCFIMLEDSFIELLSVTHPQQLGREAVNGFCFGKQMAAFSSTEFGRGEEGISLIALHSKDARHDFAMLAEKLPENQGLVDFRRKIVLSNGQPDEVAVTMGLLIDQKQPDTSWFICHQHRPDLIWREEWRQHANGAKRLLALTYVDEYPERLAQRWRGLYADNVVLHNDVVEAQTHSGLLRAMTPQQAAKQYAGVSLPKAIGARAHGIALRIEVDSLSKLCHYLDSQGVTFIADEQRVLLEPACAGNVILEFVGEGTQP
jgi:hypothetical protein